MPSAAATPAATSYAHQSRQQACIQKQSLFHNEALDGI